jgi:enoyl-CoA hydratase/carnithine racemase
MAGQTRAERSGERVTLWLENPAKRNALDIPLLANLAAEARAVATDRDVRLVVLRGKDGVFGAGADFDAIAAGDRESFTAKFSALDAALAEAVEALSAVPQPIIAVLEGPCMGGAVQLALCADIRLAAPDLKLAIPAASLGIIYPLDALDRLQRLVGSAGTKMLLFTGRRIGAIEGLEAGLINRIVPKGAMDEAIKTVESEISRAPADTIALYKKTINRLAAGGDHGELAVEQSEHNAGAAAWNSISDIMAKRAAS